MFTPFPTSFKWAATLCSALAIVMAAPVVHAQDAAGRLPWMPPEDVSNHLEKPHYDKDLIVPEIQFTNLPKTTADASRFTEIYVIDLKKFNISNDGTHAVETSRGINEALQYAKTIKANKIVFPKGTYLIHEADPIVLDHKNTIVDLNGSTLQINTNGIKEYGIVFAVDGAENLRLTNGILRGDRDTHDYKTNPGSHEWGTGLVADGGKQLEFDHLTMTNMTGDGARSNSIFTLKRNNPNSPPVRFAWVKKDDVEQGGFTAKGEKSDRQDKYRTSHPFDISKTGGQFEVGYARGYNGFPHVNGRALQLYFYDAQMKFLEVQRVNQYRKVTSPNTAAFVNMEFNQPAMTSDTEDQIVQITNLRPPTDVHFHDNISIHNRRLGMAICGGSRWILENNEFVDNGGTAPGFGIDYEDGWEFMQNIVLRKNKFRENKVGDVVLCAGSEMLIEDNDFQHILLIWSRAYNWTVRNNRNVGNTVVYETKSGVGTITGNHYKNAKINIAYDVRTAGSGLYRPEGENVATPPLILTHETLEDVRVTGSYVAFADSKLTNVKIVTDDSSNKDDDFTRLISLCNNVLVNTTITYQKRVTTPVMVYMKDNQGSVIEDGGGLSRKVAK